jgi:hypothetical protein
MHGSRPSVNSDVIFHALGDKTGGDFTLLPAES